MNQPTTPAAELATATEAPSRRQEPELVAVPMEPDQELVYGWMGLNPALLLEEPAQPLENLTVRVIRLADGKAWMWKAPGAGPVDAQLEGPGLFVSWATPGAVPPFMHAKGAGGKARRAAAAPAAPAVAMPQ